MARSVGSLQGPSDSSSQVTMAEWMEEPSIWVRVNERSRVGWPSGGRSRSSTIEHSPRGFHVSSRGLMRRDADGEGKLGLTALVALQGGAAAGTEATDGVRLVGTSLRHKTLGQRSVQVAARYIAVQASPYAAVAIR
nr:hypothetical protein Iba_chr15dCG4300 [Ipomoea batatas]